MKNTTAFVDRYGPWALIAGASVGLGEAYAESLAKRGLNLILIARRQKLLQKLADRLENQYSIKIRIISQDLGDPITIKNIDKMTKDLDIGLIIYNAAVSLVGSFFSKTLEEHQTEIDVNCTGPLAFIHIFGNRMMQKGRGGIVLMSSLSASQGSPLVTNYAATKAWNRILAEGLWYELKPKGIDVIVCVGGTIDTPNYQSSSPGKKPKAMPPKQVAEITLNDLGKKPITIPGVGNFLANIIMSHFFPRKTAIQVLGSALGKIYGNVN